MSELEPVVDGQHLDGSVKELLESLVEIATVATGYDLRRSKAPAMRANGKTDAVVADVQTVTLLRANGARRGATVYNDSTAVLYLKLGGRAAVDDWSVSMEPADYYEPPSAYKGAITGVWSAAAGQARVTEF